MARVRGELIEGAQQGVTAPIFHPVPLSAHFRVAQFGAEQGELMPAGEFLPLEIVGMIEAVPPSTFTAAMLADDDAAHGGDLRGQPDSITRPGVVVAFARRR